MTDTRWDRLAADLAAADIAGRLDEKPYSEAVYGRVQHGVTRSIFIRTAAGAVEIHDRWWRKNPEVWIGWEVHTTDREGLTLRHWLATKKRSEVVAAVRAALETVAA